MEAVRPIFVVRVLLTIAFALACLGPASTFADESIRKSIAFGATEREYYIRLPSNFSAGETYWLMIVAHGVGSDGESFFLAKDAREAADELGLNAIVVSPTFSDDTPTKSFPVLGEGEFVRSIITELSQSYRVEPKILVTGYSGGGQFAHRFCFQNPDLVAACAPFSPSNWSTPTGVLMIEGLGEIESPNSFLSNAENEELLPERRRYLFDDRVARVAGSAAAESAQNVPFLVMCGSLDPRLFLAREFARSLEESGYSVETAWPNTVHWSRRSEYASEFKQYSKRAVEFFIQVSGADIRS